MPTTWTRERAKLAALTRHHSSDSPEVAEARRDLFAAKFEEHVRAVVDAAPPLTDEQRSRLARILRGNGAAA